VEGATVSCHGYIRGVKVKGGYPCADVGAWHYVVRCSCELLKEEAPSWVQALRRFDTHLSQ